MLLWRRAREETQCNPTRPSMLARHALVLLLDVLLVGFFSDGAKENVAVLNDVPTSAVDDTSSNNNSKTEESQKINGEDPGASS